NAVCYPEKWTADGRAWEFARTETRAPPQALLEQFQAIVGEHGIDVLGLCAVSDGSRAGQVGLERTEDRKNITTVYDKVLLDGIQTEWILGHDGAWKCCTTCNPVSHDPISPAQSVPEHSAVFQF